MADYGAFIELEPGVEGLVHVSEMSWVKKNVHPGKIIATSQEVEVMVLEVDSSKRRISLGLKQTMDNPWSSFSDKHPVGSQIEGEIKNITEFGLFVGLTPELDGMVHLSDIAWDAQGEEALARFNKGAGGGGSVDMTSSNFQETIIGEATVECVSKLAAIAQADVQKSIGTEAHAAANAASASSMCRAALPIAIRAASGMRPTSCPCR